MNIPVQSAVSARKDAPASSFSSPISNPAATALETLAKQSHQIALTHSFLKLTCLQCSLLFATKPELLFYKVRRPKEMPVNNLVHFWFFQFDSFSVCIDLKMYLFCVYFCFHIWAFHVVHVEYSWEELALSFRHMGPGLELGLSGLAASALTCWAISLVWKKTCYRESCYVDRF